MSTSRRRIAVGLRRLSATATHRRSMFGAPRSSCDCRRLRHGRDHAAVRQGQAGGLAMARAVHGRRRCRADPRQDTQTRQAAAAGRHRAAGGRFGTCRPPGEASHCTGRMLAKAASVSLRSGSASLRPISSPRIAHPRHRRQLRHPQTSRGVRMACPSSALDLPLHPDFRLVAQCGRGLLRQAHAPPSQARRLPIRRTVEACHRSLHRRDQ